jgi:hypothetical protein
MSLMFGYNLGIDFVVSDSDMALFLFFGLWPWGDFNSFLFSWGKIDYFIN